MRTRSSSESGERRSCPVRRDIERRPTDECVDELWDAGPRVRSLLAGGAAAEDVAATLGSESPGLRRFTERIVMRSQQVSGDYAQKD